MLLEHTTDGSGAQKVVHALKAAQIGVLADEDACGTEEDATSGFDRVRGIHPRLPRIQWREARHTRAAVLDGGAQRGRNLFEREAVVAGIAGRMQVALWPRRMVPDVQVPE